LLRLHGAREGGERIESPRAYLSTVVPRLALDHLRSAAVRRGTYVGKWLPEPLVASSDDDPARKAEMADSLSLAFLVLLESLTPIPAVPFTSAGREKRSNVWYIRAWRATASAPRT
jgi:DNA-directed RNA polymerase specialized sigma24 family protein